MRNLLIIGAQRSGTTYLYNLLDEHPQVSMSHPVRPEPKFFMNQQLVDKGKDYYHQEYFKDKKVGSLYLGEKSTSYIESLRAAIMINETLPDARILVILRDPVLRAYSNYRFSVAHKLESKTFLEALLTESDRIESSSFTTSAYRKRGNYIDYIESYLKVFDSSQICVLVFEEFVSSIEKVQLLYRWLGVDSNYVPASLHQVINSATVTSENQCEAFKSLVLGYQDSIARLENFLGRKVEAWRVHHSKIMSGS